MSRNDQASDDPLLVSLRLGGALERELKSSEVALTLEALEPGSRLALDLEDVLSMDGGAVARLVEFRERVLGYGADLILQKVGGGARRALKIANADVLFEVEE